MSRQAPAALVANVRQVLDRAVAERPAAVAQLRAAADSRGMANVLEMELRRAGLAHDPRHHVQGITAPVHGLLVEASRRGTTVERGIREAHGIDRQVDWLLDCDRRLLEYETYLDPLADRTAGLAGLTFAQVERSVAALSTLDSIALLHFYARRAFLHHHHKSECFDELCIGDQFTDRFVGFGGLAQHAGLRTDNARERLEPVLRAHQALRGGHAGIVIGGLVSFTYDGVRGSHQPTLRVTYLDPLRISFMQEIKSRLGTRPDALKTAQQVIPMVGLPPLFGRELDHARQAQAAMRLSALLRVRAVEMFERGAVHVGHLDMEKIADESGFARGRRIGKTAASLLETWASPSPRGTPALVEFVGDPEKRMLRFGEAHAVANEAIAAAGERSIKGLNGRLEQARRKRARIERTARVTGRAA